MTVETKLVELAKGLASLRDAVEHAIVVYEDGYALHLRGGQLGVTIPLVTNHGRAVAVIHTHPVPRSAPSLADLRVLVAMAQLGVREPKLLTVHAEGGEATISVYTLRRPLPPELWLQLERDALSYELLNVESRFSPEVSEKQLREQHALLSRLSLSIERYKVKVAPTAS